MPRNAPLGIEVGDEGVDAVLADGAVVHVRPIQPADGEALVDFHENLSFESRYFRFFSPHPHLRPEEVERFTNVDGSARVALVATEAGRMIAVGRYDRMHDHEPAEAEVAFVVADAHQGRGLASLLLEHLAAVAARNGITRFVAETLPSNSRMLRVFRDTGFPVVTSLDEGVVHVEFPIDPTPRSREVSESREHRAESRSITRLLTPRSIAVIGASRDRDSAGHHVFLTLLNGGFAGPVYPVNPGAGHVASVRAYDSVLDVPGPVDVAVLAVPATAVAAVVEECAQKGVTGLVVLSGGFAEVGPDGAAEEEKVLRLARSYGMRLVGPNSIGIVNTDPDVSMHATIAVEPPVPGVAGLLSQSAALGVAMLAAAADSGLGVSSFVSVGNKADVSGNDLLQFWDDDARTEVVLLYLESFGNPRKFGRLARRVGRHKPIVVVKAGRAAGSDVAVDALFRQAGVLRVDTVQQMFDVGRVLAYQPLPAGPRLAIVTNAYGPARMAVDAADVAGLAVPDPIVDLSLSARPDDYRAAIEAVINGGAADSLLVVATPTRFAAVEAVAQAVHDTAASFAFPVVTAFLSTREEPAASRFGEGRRIPFFRTPEEAVHAIGKAVSYADWRNRGPGTAPDLEVDVTAARRVLESAGERDDCELTADETATVLAPFAIDIGNVPADSGPRRGVLHLVAGIVQDPAFGPLVRLALGGPASELVGDVAHRAVPLTDVDAGDLWRTLRIAPLLTGYRNSPPLAVDKLEALLTKVGLMADALPEISELRLDPVIVTEDDLVVGSATIIAAATAAPSLDAIRRLR